MQMQTARFFNHARKVATGFMSATVAESGEAHLLLTCTLLANEFNPPCDERPATDDTA